MGYGHLPLARFRVRARCPGCCPGARVPREIATVPSLAPRGVGPFSCLPETLTSDPYPLDLGPQILPQGTVADQNAVSPDSKPSENGRMGSPPWVVKCHHAPASATVEPCAFTACTCQK